MAQETPYSTSETPSENQGDSYSRLDAFGVSLARTRSEAIKARMLSGIEEIWRQDEEFYEGIDDANRNEDRTLWHSKPPGQAMVSAGKDKQTRSTVFPNITRPYCDMASSRIADMLMPTDDRMFAIEPTPVPDLIGLSNGNPTAETRRAIQSKFPNQQDAQDDYLARATEDANRIMADAKEKSERAQTRIEDWLTECKYTAEARRVVEDATRIGTGVLKGPYPETKEKTVYLDQGLETRTITNPVSKRVDPWNFFPDAACGENIHNGSYVWERDFLSKRQLYKLAEQEGYLPYQINLCLREGAKKAEAEYKSVGNMIDTEQKDQYEIWYCHGIAEKEDLLAAGLSIEDFADVGVEVDEDEEGDIYLPAMLVMVNNHVIKAAINPLDTGDFPYDVMVWQRRSNHWTGIGVARQIRTPQRIITAATRNLMDNAGLAAGPMIVIRQGVIASDGVFGLAPRKVFVVGPDAEAVNDARAAIGVVKVDMLVNELIEIINLGLRMAEDVTGMPMLMQGQLGKAPDTVGGMEMLFNAASSVLRRLAKLFDDLITEPQIHRYYLWLMQHGEHDDEKENFTIKARGSSALVERSIQSQELNGILNMSANPAFKIDPAKAAEEYLKSRHFVPENFQFDDEEWQQIVEKMSQPPPDSSVDVATIKAQLEQAKIESNERIKEAELQLDQYFHDSDKQQDVMFKQIDIQLENMRQEGARDISLDSLKAAFAKIKGDFARDHIKLRTQVKLANSKTPAPQVATPLAEPPQRAPAGQAYQQ